MYNPVGVVVTWFRVGAWRFRAVGAVAPVVLCTSKRPQKGGYLVCMLFSRCKKYPFQVVSLRPSYTVNGFFFSCSMVHKIEDRFHTVERFL